MPVDPSLIPYPEKGVPKKKKSALPLFIGRFFWVAFLFSVGCVFIFYLFFNSLGQGFLERQLTAAFGQLVTLEYLRVNPPFGLVCDEVKVGNLFHAKSMRISFGFPDLSGRQLNINSVDLVEPVLTLVRTQGLEWKMAGTAAQPNPASSNQLPSEPKEKDKAPRATGIWINELRAHRGTVNLMDEGHGNNFQMQLHDLELTFKKFAIPLQPVNSEFDLTAAILKTPTPFSGSKLQARGWINYPEKNMNADVKLLDPQGKDSLQATLNSIHDDLTVNGKVKIKNIITGLKPESTKSADSPLNFEEMFFSAVQSSGVEIEASFYFQTKLDRFEIGAVSFSGNMGYNVPPSNGAPVGSPAPEAGTSQSPASSGLPFSVQGIREPITNQEAQAIEAQNPTANGPEGFVTGE